LISGEAGFWQQECSAFFIAPQSPAMRLQHAISDWFMPERAAAQTSTCVAVSAHNSTATKIERQNFT
jgi:hypothetical protein